MGSNEVRTARLPAGDEPAQPATRRRSTRGRPTAEAPVVLDRYRLHRRLGAGAFGTVWMARDERLERDVAVKLLARERIVGGRFEREARAAARLAHPGIVTLYEAAVDDEGAYLVSELVRGSTLDALLAAGRLSDRDIVGIAIVLCDALEHAHAQGVVHRDVKPSNVLVPDAGGRGSSPAQLAKLTDFGVARVIDSDGLTLTGDVLGTLAYMAPEQAEGLEAGAPADLYSLALVVYEALTGVNPVRATTAFQRARRLGAHLPPLRRQRRDLPGELGRAIDCALRPRPRERGTVADLRAALRAARTVVGDEPGIVTDPWTRDDEPDGDEPEPFAPREPTETRPPPLPTTTRRGASGWTVAWPPSRPPPSPPGRRRGSSPLADAGRRRGADRRRGRPPAAPAGLAGAHRRPVRGRARSRAHGRRAGDRDRRAGTGAAAPGAPDRLAAVGGRAGAGADRPGRRLAGARLPRRRDRPARGAGRDRLVLAAAGRARPSAPRTSSTCPTCPGCRPLPPGSARSRRRRTTCCPRS